MFHLQIGSTSSEHERQTGGVQTLRQLGLKKGFDLGCTHFYEALDYIGESEAHKSVSVRASGGGEPRHTGRP